MNSGVEQAPEPVDFSTHILSLASSALVALGQIAPPGGAAMPLELDTARHLIDVLSMLEEKTRGNLNEAEAKLLSSLLYDLHVAFCAAKGTKT